MNTILVTGGAGFIGSAVIRKILSDTDDIVINYDKLTYASNLSFFHDTKKLYPNRYFFIQADICDSSILNFTFEKYKPTIVMHLAAESHVDRSIDSPRIFMQTNFIGTYEMLQAARIYYEKLDESSRNKFRFHHISTDEVYGTLGDTGFFTEETSYAPNSPYSASKASSDHLVRAWHETFSLPTLITNCSNNYGPYQFPEKLIPLIILNAYNQKPLPVYGKGDNVRDWLYVEDHADALYLVATEGKIGETYNIGGNCEKTNLEVVERICDLVDEMEGPTNRRSLISFVTDRLGHDKRYAIDASKIKRDLGFEPKETFETGLRKTIAWYLKRLDNVPT